MENSIASDLTKTQELLNLIARRGVLINLIERRGNVLMFCLLNLIGRRTGYIDVLLVLQDRARVEMDTVAYIEHGGALAGGSMLVDGDLALRQTWPLSVYGGKWAHLRSPLVSHHTGPQRVASCWNEGLSLWLGLRVCSISY